MFLKFMTGEFTISFYAVTEIALARFSFELYFKKLMEIQNSTEHFRTGESD